MLDKNSPVPLYHQLKEIIKNAIETGNYKNEESIPTEKEYMNKYDVSRSTVRKAILQLVNEGYLRRDRGKGTFVKSSPVKGKFLGYLTGFSEEMKQRGISHSTKVLEKKIDTPSRKVAEKLELTMDESIFYLKRLRFIENNPVLIVENHLPAKLCPDIEKNDFSKSSLYKTLENDYNLILHHGHREIEPMNLSSEKDIELLNASAITPVLYVESLVYTENNIPIEFYKAKIRGKFTVDIINRAKFD